ncbi:nuclear transport factor 2 family protein [Alteromonas gracilis]|uniref:nuclear transport factor 2 family protein n=1 Tax=Alteromonas gracilis TaxID=1479524 RepID=UPI0030CE65FF
MSKHELIIDLYKNAVDKKDANYLATLLTENVRFRIGNHDEIVGLDSVIDANKSFFTTIDTMSHTIEKIMVEGDYSVCHGHVDYKRLDGSHTSSMFATVVKYKGDKISDYLVFADLSAL